MKLNPVIQIDTREQNPLFFPEHEILVEKLDVGDYGIVGCSDWDNPQFIVERKSKGDLIGSLTQGRERFWREVLKLRQFNFAAIVVEAHLSEIQGQDYRSQATPQSIIQSLYAIAVRADVHVFWCGGPSGAADCVSGLVRQYVRGIEKQMKALG